MSPCKQNLTLFVVCDDCVEAEDVAMVCVVEIGHFCFDVDGDADEESCVGSDSPFLSEILVDSNDDGRRHGLKIIDQGLLAVSSQFGPIRCLCGDRQLVSRCKQNSDPSANRVGHPDSLDRNAPFLDARPLGRQGSWDASCTEVRIVLNFGLDSQISVCSLNCSINTPSMPHAVKNASGKTKPAFVLEG